MRRVRPAALLPDVLYLHCSAAVAEAAQALVAALMSMKDTARRSADARDGAARVFLPPRTPVRLEPLLAVLDAHPAVRVDLDVAACALLVRGAAPFGDVAQRPASLARALAAAARCPAADVRPLPPIKYQDCAFCHVQAPGAQLRLHNLLAFRATLRAAWLYVDGGVGLVEKIESPI